jgi:hypothetical protein
MSVTGKTRAANQQQQATAAANAANIQAAQITTAAGTQVAQIQSDAALRAAEMSAGAALGGASMIAGASAYAANLASEAAARSLEEQKRQFDTATEDLSVYRELGQKYVPIIDDAATAAGFQARLTEIMDTDVFNQLRDERQEAASGALGQAGLTRSGQAARSAAELTTDLALGIDNTLYGRQLNNVNLGQAASARQAAAGQNYANAVTGIETGTAAQIGNITINGATNSAGFFTDAANSLANGINNSAFHTGTGIMSGANANANALVNSANLGVQNANNNAQAVSDRTANTISAIASVVAAFSDERLKEDMTPINQVADLTLYKWKWKDEYKDYPMTEMTTGFSAQEVEKKYPDCVIEVGQIKAILYPKLYKQLEARLAS